MRTRVAVGIIAWLLVAPVLAPAQPRSDSVVILSAVSPLGYMAGNAVMIGDGTYALTARHLIFLGPEAADSESMGVVNLFSPYLGDRCEGYLVAENAELDLALLRTPWKGHPSAELATDEQLRAAREVEIDSRFEPAMKLIRGDMAAMDLIGHISHDRLQIDVLGVRGDDIRRILTHGSGKVERGWSGSPVFLANTSLVAGITSSVNVRKGSRASQMNAFAAQPARAIMHEKGLVDSLAKPLAFLPRPADAEEVIKLWVESRHFIHTKRYEDWARNAEALIKVRPNHPLAHLSLASAQEDLKNPSAAEAAYRKAIELDPNTVTARIYYAQFLNQSMRFSEASEVLEKARSLDPLNTAWGAALVQALGREQRFEECFAVAHEVLARSPYDGFVWMVLADAQRVGGDRAEYMKSLERASQLLGPVSPPSVLFAGELLDARRFEEAEKLILGFINEQPQHAMGRFMLGDLFYRKGRLSDAVFEAERALDLPEAVNPSRTTIRAAITKWKGAATRPASTPPPFGL